MILNTLQDQLEEVAKSDSHLTQDSHRRMRNKPLIKVMKQTANMSIARTTKQKPKEAKIDFTDKLISKSAKGQGGNANLQ